MHGKPLIAITLGDPAGIGPEIIVGAWTESVVHEWCRPLVVGHPGVIRRAVELWQTELHVQEIVSPDEAEPSDGVIPCLACGSDDVLEVAPGKLDARAGQAAYNAVVDGGSAGPLRPGRRHRHRAAAKRGPPPGRAHLSRPHGIAGQPLRRRELRHDALPGSGRVLRSPAGLAVVHVTLHTALRNVFRELNEEAVLAKARLAHDFMSSADGRPAADCRLSP